MCNYLNKADIVIPWVDGNDPEWQKKKARFTQGNDYDSSEETYNGTMRYRDYGTLKYLFRSIEQNAQWVNHVFLVTDNQKPEWLDDNYSKVTVVDHKDFINSRYLPTFNTNTIELNVHHISGLNQNFVLLNDDMLFNDKTTIDDFFKGDLPVDSMSFSVIPSQNDFSHILLNDMLIINKHFSKKNVLRKNWKKIFNLKNGKLVLRSFLSLPWTGITGFYNQHQGIAYTKNSFENMWNLETEKLEETCSHRIRSTDDVSDWVIRYYQMCSGKFYAGFSNKSAFFTVDEVERLKRELVGNKHHKFICINDVDQESDFSEKAVTEVASYLNERFPDRSKYEKAKN